MAVAAPRPALRSGDELTGKEAGSQAERASPSADTASPRQADPRPERRGRWLLAVLVLALLAVAAVGIRQGARLSAQHRLAARDAAVLTAARQTAVDFTTLDYRTLDRDLARVAGEATGDFRQQFDATTTSLRSLVTANRATSKGRVLEAGIVRVTDTTARVLVVADSTVTNTATKQPSTRHYRLQLDLAKVKGAWLTSGLEFVG